MQAQPIVVAYGMGVDSTAMLIGLHQRGIRPDLILFADTGGEKPETYLYAPISKQHEVIQLGADSPELFQAARSLEKRYRDGKHYRRDDPKAVQGLGIRRTWSEILN